MGLSVNTLRNVERGIWHTYLWKNEIVNRYEKYSCTKRKNGDNDKLTIKMKIISQ